ncbi:hypothetical protein [Pseudomonas sp. B392_1p]|uniref:hypothetical protein n=1 Tax=Pseudomonas sp. B392_1p TaxID=3457507 RepID=UPI003FD2E8BB
MSLKTLFAVLAITLGSCLHAQGAVPEMQRIQEMRSLAYLATTNLMVFYNLDATPFEAENAKSYHQSFERLQQIASQHNYSLVSAELRKIEDLAGQLEAFPRDLKHVRTVYIPYQLLLNPLFEAQQRIDQDLEQRYTALANGNDDEWQQELHALSLDHSRIMLQYSMLTFTPLAYLNLQDPTLSGIDERIRQQFETLRTRYPEQRGELKKLGTSYNFIRQRLVAQPRPWMPGRALFYLSHNAKALDEAAARNMSR